MRSTSTPRKQRARQALRNRPRLASFIGGHGDFSYGWLARHPPLRFPRELRDHDGAAQHHSLLLRSILRRLTQSRHRQMPQESKRLPFTSRRWRPAARRATIKMLGAPQDSASARHYAIGRRFLLILRCRTAYIPREGYRVSVFSAPQPNGQGESRSVPHSRDSHHAALPLYL